MKNKKVFNFNIVTLSCVLYLTGCGTFKDLIPYENDNISIEKSVERENNTAVEETEDTQQWADRIYEVTADNMQGNILGYSLIRRPPNPDNMYYERDMPYLLEESMVGKGIYISDYMCETEVFLGNLLKEVLMGRGTVSDENRPFFTEYALQQIEGIDWEELDAGWECVPWAYDRTYRMIPVSGGCGYQFFYCFYPDEDKVSGEESCQAEIMVYVDGDGKVCQIKISFNTVLAENNRMVKYIQTEGLFDDTYSEQIILDGSPCKEMMEWDFERYFRRFMYPDETYEQENNGLLASGNVCDSAENLADIFFQIMDNRGKEVEKYAKWFGDEKYFTNFVDTDWGLLEDNWIADENYDCFFIDRIEDAGYIGFQYYFYPDFEAMDADMAKMVVIECNVSITEGMLDYNAVDIFPITQAAYLDMKQKQTGSRILVVEKGNVLAGKETVAIPVIDREIEPVLIKEFTFQSVPVLHSDRKVKKELWGFTDIAQVSDDLGQKFFWDFDEDNVEEGEIYKAAKNEEAVSSALYDIDQFLEAGWKADRQYDCFIIKANEAAGYMHLQYYFYPESVNVEQMKGKILVINVYLSDAGIENMVVNEICGGDSYQEITKRDEVQESKTTELYQEVLQSAQLDWNWVIEPGEYDDIQFLGGEYIAVKKKNGKYGIINSDGEFICSEEYDFISAYSESMASVEKDQEHFYIDKKGKKVIEGGFQTARSFHEKRAAVQMCDSWGFINPNGELIIACQFEQVNDFQEGCAAVKNQSGWGYVDETGRMIVPCQYDEARDYKEGVAAVRRGNFWGFVNEKGEIETACQYDEVKDFQEGCAAVKKDDKWGYIDKTGQIIIEPMYDDVGSFSEGKASVKQNGQSQECMDKWAYIDQTNTAVIDYYPYYTAGEFRMNVGEFQDGLAFVSDGLPCIINDRGEYVFDGSDSVFFICDTVYDPGYKAIPAYVFTDDAMMVRKYGLMGIDGNCLLEPIFDYIEVPYEDYVKVEVKVDEEWCHGVIQIREKQQDINS